MKPKTLLEAGRLDEAIEALGAELREQPEDVQRRMFLFELLCFAGNFDRAGKQLSILAENDASSRAGSMFYRTVLDAEQFRQSLFASGNFPVSDGAPSGPGAWNGQNFGVLEDADPRTGSHFEFITVSGYHRIPLRDITTVEIDPPARLRDLIWARGRLQVRYEAQSDDTLEVLIPVLTPGAAKHSDPQVRLGRVTVWENDGGAEVPYGQKMYQTDADAYPVLELRRLEMGSR